MLNRIILFLIVWIFGMPVFSQQVQIETVVGWLESAYVKWLPVEGTESYNVYYSGQGLIDEKIDEQQIRNYGTYFRADVMGMKAGDYSIRIVPVNSGIEGQAVDSDILSVTAHDRTGFAFVNGQVPGAYQADGTPKDNAVIIYITEKTKNTVSLDVSGANENPCIGLQSILEGFKKGQDNRPLIVRFIGQITDLDVMDKGDLVIENNNNPSSYITLEGIGDDAVADGWGIRIKNASNIEVRNLGTMNSNSDEGDNIGLQQSNDYIWVHHCDFFYGDAGSDSDQAKGDGALDCKKSNHVTFSYNHFWDTGKSNLLGLSEGAESNLYITYHHNWYDHSDSRHPRVRYYSAHVYNNYYDGNAKYGVGATESSSVFAEANYFRNCKYPMLTSMQGSDVYDEDTGSNDYSDMPTFSKEDGGSIKAFNNVMTGQKRFVDYGSLDYPNSTVDFDAFVAGSRDELVSSSVLSFKGQNTYNNFDTDASVMYAYYVESPEEAKETVMALAGRIEGGDFHWNFNNTTDDASYDVISELKTSLKTYKTKMISVQGDTVKTSGEDPDGNEEEITGDVVHNFTLAGTSSTYFNISGNLSDSKGTVNYADLSLTQCLKIESSTLISFKTIQESTLTLVFNTDFSGKIKVNNASYSAEEGRLSILLPAGSHEIQKENVANLFYMSIFYPSSNLINTLDPKPFIYPNPVLNSLHIKSDAHLKRVDIYNLAGVLIKRSKVNPETIDLSELSQGIYMILVVSERGIFKQSFFKK